MRRHLLPAGALAALLLAGMGAPAAQTAVHRDAKAAFRKLVSRMKPFAGRSVSPQSVGVRNHTSAFLLETGVVLFLDRDDDGDLTFGDELIVNGPLLNYASRRDVGTWEGKLTITNDVTWYNNLTLLFAGSGTLTITGAAHIDGARTEVFLAPIVGTTGRVRASGNAGFFNDTAGNLVVVIGAR